VRTGWGRVTGCQAQTSAPSRQAASGNRFVYLAKDDVIAADRRELEHHFTAE